MTFEIAAFRATDARRMSEARRIRQIVFCDEQGVEAHEEWDDKDGLCEHFVLSENGVGIGTARVRPYGPGISKIERVAVMKHRRGTGAGKALMEDIMARLMAANVATVVINSQMAVEGFYRKFGFISEGSVFVEANIPHVHMIWRPESSSPPSL